MTQDRTVSSIDAAGSTDAPAASRRLAWTPVVGLVASVLAWFRVPAPFRDNLYAEDGVLFVGDWLWRGRLGLFWEPYAGYQHLLPRAGSWFVTTFLPVASWGYAMTAISCGLVGLVAAAVYAWSADLVTFWPARVVLGLLVVLVPVAGVEPLGNLANVHWFMFMLMPWALMATPRTRGGLAVVAVATLAATLTEPTCFLFAPLALWRFISAPRSRVIVISWALGVGAQALTVLVSPRPRTPGEPPWMSLILGYVRDVGMSMFTWRPRLLGLTVNTVGWWVGFVWVILLLVLAIAAARFARRDTRLLIATLVLASIASWSTSVLANNIPDFFYSEMPASQLLTTVPVRWATASSAMLASVIPIAASVFVGRFPRLRGGAWGVLGVMLAVLLVNLPARSVSDRPSWSDQVDRGIAACRADGTPLQVVTGPDNWELGIPCAFTGS